MLGKHYRKQLDAIAQSNGTLHYGLLWYIIGKRAGKPITFTKNYTMWNQCCFVSLCCHLAGREVTVFNKQALCASMWWVFRSPVDTNVTGQCDAKGKTKQNTLSHETWILRRKRNYVITRINNTMWVSLHTKGSGDPSSGCICNTAGPQVSVIESYSAWLNAVGCISCGLFSVVAQAESHTYHRLNNGDIDQASATGSGHRNGLLRRHRQFNHTAISSSSNSLSSHLTTD